MAGKNKKHLRSTEKRRGRVPRRGGRPACPLRSCQYPPLEIESLAVCRSNKDVTGERLCNSRINTRRRTIVNLFTIYKRILREVKVCLYRNAGNEGEAKWKFGIDILDIRVTWA